MWEKWSRSERLLRGGAADLRDEARRRQRCRLEPRPFPWHADGVRGQAEAAADVELEEAFQHLHQDSERLLVVAGQGRLVGSIERLAELEDVVVHRRAV